jgi:ribosomal protein S18 acetylase RimI-like enzyme
MLREDTAAAAAISADAGLRFADIDDARVAASAHDAPLTIDELSAHLDDGRAWVATEDEHVVGFAVLDLVDGAAHIEEIDVARDAGRRGHGARLLDAIAQWAQSSGLDAVTLTTFRDVAWNAPWYARNGYRVLHERELTPQLRALRDKEDADGLPADLRVVMRFDLG